MAVVVTDGGLDDPVVQRLLADHARELRAVSPPGSAHVLDLAGLQVPAARFFTAREGDVPVGCVALQVLDDGDAELKSMRVAREHTGRGIGRLLLDHVLAAAREAGLVRVSLETGSQDFFAPAVALYRSAGFEPCGPFGDYRADPASRFLTLRL